MKPTKEQRQRLEEDRLNAEAEDQRRRARSITVGTAFGGSTEVTMRGSGGNFLYSIMQPVEVVELIHQLSANVGCHLQLIPRQDFASWRDWKVSEEQLEHTRGIQATQGLGFAPFVNDMAPHAQVGANLPSPEEQAGLPNNLNVPEKKNVATKKAINKRTTKRSRATAK